ncbi:YWFCY domain-containing protein [Pedobacter caeni]|uniref:YWFCY protein n=1 Tax=Pedobacter caeni TaxID=288992 RepID=A0A1M5C0R4_9SPHI|nr:YWFCY domain-containing protein [Pedobacter caeni]SHF48256.1 YWFCY protein [Pedobacter caeni]
MNAGEDTQSLRKIIEFTRLISIFILSIHFYMCCYMAFKRFGWTAEITDRIILNISKTGLFDDLLTPKLGSLILLIYLFLALKDEKIRHIVDQHIKKGFSMFIYDYKFDDLSKIAYNNLLQYQGNYAIKPKFFVIDFDKIFHRCNPLDPESMDDFTDATESGRTIMLGLNKDWSKKSGDFFVESPINFFTTR